MAEDIRARRCGAQRHADIVAGATSQSEACRDIAFYLVEVNFDALMGGSERTYLKGLRASPNLPLRAWINCGMQPVGY